MTRYRARGIIRLDVTAATTKEAGEKALKLAKEITAKYPGRVDLRAIGPNVILERL